MTVAWTHQFARIAKNVIVNQCQQTYCVALLAPVHIRDMFPILEMGFVIQSWMSRSVYLMAVIVQMTMRRHALCRNGGRYLSIF